MAWYADYEVRRSRLLQDGLLVLVQNVRIDPATGFIGIYLLANESDLLRSNADRGFDLHVSLGFASDYGDGVAVEAVERLNGRWRNRLLRLRISWVGGGGSVQLATDDFLYNDSDVWWLHSRGWYGNGLRVKPRNLHVSL